MPPPGIEHDLQREHPATKGQGNPLSVETRSARREETDKPAEHRGEFSKREKRVRNPLHAAKRPASSKRKKLIRHADAPRQCRSIEDSRRSHAGRHPRRAAFAGSASRAASHDDAHFHHGLPQPGRDDQVQALSLPPCVDHGNAQSQSAATVRWSWRSLANAGSRVSCVSLSYQSASMNCKPCATPGTLRWRRTQ